MPWENQSKNISLKRLLILLLFIGVFLLTRVPRLQNDIINPDGVNWHYRSQMFFNGLKYGDLVKTYQHYHPGVTLMWITGTAIELYRQFPGNTIYNIYNFAGFDFVAKYTLVIAQLGLSVLLIYYLAKILGFNKSVLVTALFSLDPFFLGNSRLYHLDALLTLFLFLGLCTFYLAIQSSKTSYYLLTGFFVGLAFLTKTVSITLFAYLFLYLLLVGLLTKSIKNKLLPLLIFTGVFCLTVFALFPALWVRPGYFIVNLFSEGVRVGVRKGHEVVVMGEELTDGGLLFYPLVLLIKLSPFLLFGGIGYLISVVINSIKKGLKLNIKELLQNNFSVLLSGFFLGFLIIMTVPSKKLDRYMLVEFPFFAFCTVMFIEQLLNRFAKHKQVILNSILFLYGVFVIYPIFNLFPYYFTYTSPLVGSPKTANSLIGQKPFGVGMYDLKDFILKKYGDFPSLAFIDTKPMDSIYPNSLVFDVRETAPDKYSLIILGPNEEIPAKAYRADIEWNKDSSIYINGLEYWRIYVKRSK